MRSEALRLRGVVGLPCGGGAGPLQRVRASRVSHTRLEYAFTPTGSATLFMNSALSTGSGVTSECEHSNHHAHFGLRHRR